MSILSEFPGRSFHPLVRKLIAAGEAEDTSWHNDAAPTVTSHEKGKGWVILSDAGADREQWEDSGPGACRFAVWSCDAEGCDREDNIETDDPLSAVVRFRLLAESEAVQALINRMVVERLGGDPE